MVQLDPVEAVDSNLILFLILVRVRVVQHCPFAPRLL